MAVTLTFCQSLRLAAAGAADAASGNCEQALAKLPALMGACIACHASYRPR